MRNLPHILCFIFLVIASLSNSFSFHPTTAFVKTQNKYLGSPHSFSTSRHYYGDEHLPRLFSKLNSNTDLIEATSTTTTPDYASDLKKTALWISAALAFDSVIAVTKGSASAIEFASGYVLEYCLSVDNLFVFLVLFDYFNIKDKKMEEKVNAHPIKSI